MLSGVAADDVGVTSVTWVNDRGGSGTAVGTTSWSVANCNLQEGVNVITVTARDAAGNIGTAVLTVTLDTTPPVVTITSPTSLPTLSVNQSTIVLSGTASDNVGLDSLFWGSDRLGFSGPVSGTTSWTSSPIPLLPGANVITVTAIDLAGNTSSDVITITFIQSPFVRGFLS